MISFAISARSTWSRRLPLLSSCVLLWALIPQPGSHAADKPKGFDAFPLVKSRNVFDPDRRGGRTESAPTAPVSNRPAGVMLTGTMVTEGKTLAFFSSQRSEFNKVIGTRDQIAGFTVASIEAGRVQLEHDGKAIAISVGQPLPIEGAAPPGIPLEAAPAADGSANSSTSTSTPSAAPAAPASPNDVLRQMMERRQKEMSQ